MENKEYIERGAVIDILRKYSTENPSSLGRHSGVADIAMCEVDRLPTADVVEVVRCKDCVWWEIRGLPGTVGRCENPHNGLWNEYTYACDYCSYGERKEK